MKPSPTILLKFHQDKFSIVDMVAFLLIITVLFQLVPIYIFIIVA